MTKLERAAAFLSPQFLRNVCLGTFPLSRPRNLSIHWRRNGLPVRNKWRQFPANLNTIGDAVETRQAINRHTGSFRSTFRTIPDRARSSAWLLLLLLLLLLLGRR